MARVRSDGARVCVSECAADELSTEAGLCVKSCGPTEFQLGKTCVRTCPEKTRTLLGECVSYRSQSLVWAWVVLGLSLGLCAAMVVVFLVYVFRKPRAPASEREYEKRLRELKAERQM